MKRLKLLLWAFIGIIAIFVAIMAYVRLDNSKQLRHRFYLQWRRDYVVKYEDDESFINTTPRTHKTMAFSEGQGYGMYINVLAAENGWGKEKNFERLNNFYLAHRERIAKTTTGLMSWRMIEKRENGRSIKIVQQMETYLLRKLCLKQVKSGTMSNLKMKLGH